MSPAEKIQRLLSDRPGLKAQQIADELGIDKSQVSAALYGPLGGEVVQDNTYRWWPRTRPSPAEEAGTRTPLAQLCRYYLECISRESETGISIPAGGEGTEYVTLSALPFSGGTVLSAADRSLKKLIQKVRRERSQLALYVGYAVRVRVLSGRDIEETRLEPVLLYPIEEALEFGQPLRPATTIPLFNQEVLKNLPSVDSGNATDEAIQLAEELGLANPDDDLPQWDEIVLRLRHHRPEWDWREDLDPFHLSKEPRLEELPPGIYNRALLFAGTRSPFTYGLEVELRKLAQLDEQAVQGTALGQWLRGEIGTAVAEDRPILEVLPSNTEQRQAVVQGLTAPLTVVTGPPGTGKSQVVATLLVNQAWHGGSALFASKNNHAVDVVEARVNELGPSPLLLRLGREEHHARLAQQLGATLAESSRPGDSAAYQWLAEGHEAMRARYSAVLHEIAAVVALRNRVDELERLAEPARELFPGKAFRELRSLDGEAIRARLDRLAEAIEDSAAARAVWDPMKGRRLARIGDAAGELRDDAAHLGIGSPEPGAAEADSAIWRAFHHSLAERLDLAVRARDYLRSLDRLRAATPVEELAGKLTRIGDESAQNARELWQTWLRLRPGRWKPEERRLLSEYVSLLQMISGGDRFDEGAGRGVFRRYYSLFPKVTRLLPCWAVTSLSARGRLPFEPGLFDLVVIDGASQCDIASALPVLFRARRAVIIGDPL